MFKSRGKSRVYVVMVCALKSGTPNYCIMCSHAQYAVLNTQKWKPMSLPIACSVPCEFPSRFSHAQSGYIATRIRDGLAVIVTFN